MPTASASSLASSAAADRHADAVKLPELEDLPDVAGRNVLVRCDFNVPLAEGRVDDSRIRSVQPTLGWLVDRGAHVTTCTHLGRPKGKPDPRFDVDPIRPGWPSWLPGGPAQQAAVRPR
jgi:phosphoglycerate kinase